MSLRDLKIAVENPDDHTFELMSIDELESLFEKKLSQFGITKITSFTEDQIKTSAEKYYQILKRSSEIPRDFVEVAYNIYKKTSEDNPECQAFEGIDFTDVDTFKNSSSVYRNSSIEDVEKAFKELIDNYPAMGSIMMSGIITTLSDIYLKNLNQDRLNDFTHSTTIKAKSASYSGSNFKFASIINQMIMTLNLFAKQDLFFANFDFIKGLL